jgi:ABC-type polar amino acid transport system ATPase subunit
MAQVFDEIRSNVQERVHFGVPKTMIFDNFMSILDNFVLEDVKKYVEDLDRL